MKLIIYYLIIVIPTIFLSCSTSNKENNYEYYKVNAFNNSLIIGYNLISLIDSEGNKRILLATRLGTGVDEPYFKKYDSIRVGEKYKLKITLSSIEKLEPVNKINYINDTFIYFDNLTILKNDSVMVPLYISNDVFDKFVKIDN